MEFEVTVLGANSAIPAHGRNQTSQLVRLGTTFMLIDCGEGTQLQLRKFKLKFSKIDFIFISHLHGDHYLGLMGLISSFHLNKRTRLLTIFGPSGLDEIITVNLKYSNTRLNFPLRFVQTNPLQKELVLEEKTFKVYSFPLEHRIPCTGFLIEEKSGLRKLVKDKLQETKLPVSAILELRKGNEVKDKHGKTIYSLAEYTYPLKPLRSYAFCSDTIFNPDLCNFFKGVDLLYHEATFLDDENQRAKETYHSTASQAAEVARRCDARQLLLGHFSTRYKDLSPILAEAKTNFPNSMLSEEGKTYQIG